ncbi:MAG: hypothetical protein ACFE0J_20135 [Elainellaceae cyanobacterium]
MLSHVVIYLAYGEGQSASTATGVFAGLVVLVLLCVLVGVYSYKTYPADRP